MNFRRQRQAALARWQARRILHQLVDGFGPLENLLRGMSCQPPLPLTPYECPARVGGMAGAGGNQNRVCIKTRLNLFDQNSIAGCNVSFWKGWRGLMLCVHRPLPICWTRLFPPAANYLKEIARAIGLTGMNAKTEIESWLTGVTQTIRLLRLARICRGSVDALVPEEAMPMPARRLIPIKVHAATRFAPRVCFRRPQLESLQDFGRIEQFLRANRRRPS
jgi:hypothetical protein